MTLIKYLFLSSILFIKPSAFPVPDQESTASAPHSGTALNTLSLIIDTDSFNIPILIKDEFGKKSERTFQLKSILTEDESTNTFEGRSDRGTNVLLTSSRESRDPRPHNIQLRKEAAHMWKAKGVLYHYGMAFWEGFGLDISIRDGQHWLATKPPPGYVPLKERLAKFVGKPWRDCVREMAFFKAELHHLQLDLLEKSDWHFFVNDTSGDHTIYVPADPLAIPKPIFMRYRGTFSLLDLSNKLEWPQGREQMTQKLEEGLKSQWETLKDSMAAPCRYTGPPLEQILAAPPI